MKLRGNLQARKRGFGDISVPVILGEPDALFCLPLPTEGLNRGCLTFSRCADRKRRKVGKLRKTWCADVMTSSHCPTLPCTCQTLMWASGRAHALPSRHTSGSAIIWICRHPGLNMTGTALLRIPPLLRRPEAVWRPCRVEHIHPHRVD